MKKKLLLLGLMTAVFLGTSSVAMAADDTTQVVLSTGNILSIEATGNAFEDMYPGDTRVQEIKLVNNGSNSVKFFMQTTGEDMESGGSALQGAAYNMNITASGIVYTGSVGGAEDSSGSVSEELSDFTLENLANEDGVLVATLGAGQSVSLYVQLGIDGESMGNDYQAAEGALNFDFWAQLISQNPERIYITQYRSIPGKVTVIKTVKTVVLSARTGDPAAIGILAAAMGGCLAIIVLCVVIMKKRRSGVEK